MSHDQDCHNAQMHVLVIMVKTFQTLLWNLNVNNSGSNLVCSRVYSVLVGKSLFKVYSVLVGKSLFKVYSVLVANSLFKVYSVLVANSLFKVSSVLVGIV